MHVHNLRAAFFLIKKSFLFVLKPTGVTDVLYHVSLLEVDNVLVVSLHDIWVDDAYLGSSTRCIFNFPKELQFDTSKDTMRQYTIIT